MSYQQCEFNFGAKPFKYLPTLVQFKCFNDFGHLSNDEKKIISRHQKLAELRNVKVNEESCNVCYDNQANIILMPCNHTDMCSSCDMQLESCPICRKQIVERRERTTLPPSLRGSGSKINGRSRESSLKNRSRKSSIDSKSSISDSQS